MHFIPGMQGWFNIQTSVEHTMTTDERKKKEKHEQNRKSLWQKSTSIYDKIEISENLERKNFLNSIKVSLKPIENVILMMKDCLPTGIRESKLQFPEFLMLP